MQKPAHTLLKRLLSLVFTLLALQLLFIEDSFAQYGHFNKKNRYSCIGLSLNAINYVGEVDPSSSIISPALRFTRPFIGGFYMYKWKPHIFLRGAISYGQIGGSDYKNAGYGTNDIYRKLRNQTFRNNIFEVKFDVVYDLVGNSLHYRKRPDYVPYVFLGIAYFHHNPQGLSSSGQWVNLKPLSTEGEGLPGGPKKYSLHQIAIPIGIGFRHKISRQLDIAFEIGWRFTFTDYLDDISTNYYDRDLLNQYKGAQAVAMSDHTMEAIAKDQKLKDFVLNRQGGLVSKDNQTVSSNTTQSKDTYIYSYNIPGAKRGSKNKDWYVVTGFHLIYIFPPRVICPKFRN
jgi:hypothetical protein